MTELVRIRVQCNACQRVTDPSFWPGVHVDDSCASDQDDLLYQRDFKGSTICPPLPVPVHQGPAARGAAVPLPRDC